MLQETGHVGFTKQGTRGPNVGSFLIEPNQTLLEQNQIFGMEPEGPFF